MRIVSVLPSATEIVCALGLRDALVGRSEECDYPASVRSLPVVMRAKVADHDRSSAEIDRRVQAARGAGESLYTLDVGRLAELRPDVILTQDLCGVCSVTTEDVAQGCARAGLRPRIVTLTPRTLEGVWGSVELVGSAVGEPERAHRYARELRKRVRSDGGPTGTPPRVAVLEWLDPPILAGLWVPEMITVAGGEPLGPRSGEVGERTDWEQLARLRPELVVVSPCSYPVDRTLTELRESGRAGALTRLRPRLGTWILDEAYFSRPGPRLADGATLLRALLKGAAPPTEAAPASWASLERSAAEGSA